MSMYAYWLANTGLTVHKLTGLMTEGIGAEELYALQESQMKKIRVLDEKDVEKITQSRRHWDVQEHWGKLQGEGIGFVCVEDARYPQKLRRISATPYALYYIGRLPEETRKSVAIVGARTRSAYGSQITGKLARALAQNRMDIISGMAMGIDADAHSGALEENGDTYAVLGCGVDVCYPKRNRYLYEKMQDRGGILSEYPPGTPPLPGYFPQRNRIIAGLADYVIVMEARKKSGSRYLNQERMQVRTIERTILICCFGSSSISSSSSTSYSLVPFSTPHPSTCITVIPRTPALLSAAFKLENFDMPVITSILDKLMVFPPWYNALYNSSSGIFVPVMSRS